MSSLDKVVAFSSTQAASDSGGEPDGRAAAGLVLATAAADALTEAVHLILTGQPVPAGLILGAHTAMSGLAVGQDNWVEATAYDPFPLRLAGADAAKSPYGDVDYADPGYQADGKKRYPVDSEEHIRAAWSYIHKGHNAAAYNSKQLASIKAKIRSAGSKHGVQFEDSDQLAASNLELAGGRGEVSSAPLTELLHLDHPPMHGVHSHGHVHIEDCLHGPRGMSLAAKHGKANLPTDEYSAFVHKAMTGAHSHRHVHAGDASHGPLEKPSPFNGRPDTSW